MRTLLDRLLTDEETFLEVTDEDAGFSILQDLVSRGRWNKFSPYSDKEVFISEVRGSPQLRWQETRIVAVFLEGLSWLFRHGLAAEWRDGVGDWSFVTRKGLAAAELGSAAKVGTRLDGARLVEALALRVRPLYSAGQFDSAIMQAFKEVEVAVRKAGGYEAKDVGVDLMRKAFHPQNGPLSDSSVVPAEREALSSLFAGAIGYAKNPHSHRNVGTDDPNEALELILFANHLLRIVASRVRP